jgi:hypothetical protein
MECMPQMKIIISGPGLIVNHPVTRIEKLLTDMGCVVTVNNPHPEDPGNFHDITEKVINETGQSPYKVKLIVKHEPWGG